MTHNSATKSIEKLITEKKWRELEALSRNTIGTETNQTEARIGEITALLMLEKSHESDSAITSYLDDQLDTNALLQLANYLFKNHHFTQAKQITKISLNQLDEKNVNLIAWIKLGTSLGQLDLAYSAAIKYYQHRNKDPDIRSLIAELHVIFGKKDLAASIYEDLLQEFPTAFKIHYEFSKLTTARNDTHLNQMLKLIQKLPKLDSRSIWLHYAAGKELEDLKEFSAAFEHFEIGGQLALKNSKYDINDDIRILELLGEHPPSNQLPATQASANDSPTPIFILGLPRSGSTLLERIITSHPDIESIGETYFFQVALQNICNLPNNITPTLELVKQSIHADPLSVRTEYLKLTKHLRQGKRYFVEKLPENFIYIDLIKRSFPEAKIIYTERNTLDNCIGIFKQPFFRFSYNLEHLARYVKSHKSLFHIFTKRHKDEIFIVNYENLVTSTQTITDKIANYLSISNKFILDPSQNSTPVNTASSHQISENINKKYVGRSTNYKAQLTPLIDLLS